MTKCVNCTYDFDAPCMCECCTRAKASVAVDLIESLATGDFHRGEDISQYPSRHLRSFIEADGKLRCFLRELARYVDRLERVARKDQL